MCEFPHKLTHKTIEKIKIVTHILVDFRTGFPALTKISNLTGTETKMSVYVQILAATLTEPNFRRSLLSR
jgi:hypothetical protein